MKQVVLNILLALGATWTATRSEALVAPKTVDDRIQEFGDKARKRLRKKYESVGLSYPPLHTTLVYFKSTRSVELYGRSSERPPWRKVAITPVLAVSGTIGPKLRRGDEQVPEGLYRIEALNPNSAYHVSLRINYPNSFDRARARDDRRTNLGGDIMIHGKNVSIGCLAMGDEVAEDLFTLAKDTDYRKWTLILSPIDFRSESLDPKLLKKLPSWVPGLYSEIEAALRTLSSD
jgi:murein L,D-transpeptidase YafK